MREVLGWLLACCRFDFAPGSVFLRRLIELDDAVLLQIIAP
jgi:hypothetical protein